MGLCLRPEMLRGGHRVELHRDGAEAYPRMLEAIRGARASVFLEMYIFAEDAIGKRFAETLVERAKAGVDVRLMYDAAGSKDSSREFFGELRSQGVKVVEFNPLARFWGGFRFRRRNHRKLLVVDGRVAFLGGINIARDYASTADGGLGWRDTGVALEGPCVADLAAMFAEIWTRERRRRDPPIVPGAAPAGEGARVLVLSSQRYRDRWEIAQHYRHAIRQARSRVWIANAYFLPSRRFRRALREAAWRGVDVRLLLPSRSDFAPVLYAAQRLFASYLRAGMRIFEWPGAMMHAKCAVVDGAWSTVGSFNIDHLSLINNYELTAVVDDRDFGARMESMFERDFAQCREITRDGWKRRGWTRRWLELLCHPFRTLF